MKTMRCFFWIGALFAFLSTNLYAQGGHACDSATVAVTGSNLADNAGYMDQWYVYTATMDGKMIVSACDTTFYDTYVTIYEGNCYSSIGYNDSYCDYHARLAVPVQTGVTYYINWSGYWTDATYNWTWKNLLLIPANFAPIPLQLLKAPIQPTIPPALTSGMNIPLLLTAK